MQLSKKESSLIEIFLSEKNRLTAKEIAEKLNVSTKTVYRLVKKINDVNKDGPIIDSQSGKGLSLNYRNYLEFVNEPEEGKNQDPEDRRSNVLLELLFKSPHAINIKELYVDYFLTAESIVKDFEKIRRIIETYHLSLIKKEGKAAIQGKEKNIRRLSYKLISMNSFLTGNSYSVNGDNINSYDADFITSLLDSIEKQLGNTIPYPYNINIFSHIYILLSRFRKGKVALPNNHPLEALDIEEKNLIEINPEKFLIAQNIIERINAYLHTSVPDSEVFYLFQHILSSRVESLDDIDEPAGISDEMKLIVESLVSSLNQKLKISFDKILTDGQFLEHFRLMLYRSKHGISIKNAINQDIKREYGMLFKALSESFDEVMHKAQMKKISLDEVGFVTLYFAKIHEEQKFKKKVLIMCSSGVGTSELLKIKVQRSFPDLEIVDVVSMNVYKKKYEKEAEKFFDLILTTVKLDNQSELPSLLVNFMFTQQDQENVMKLLEEI
ncbi:BglG family transcription antiterminator [Enterococcus sp. LJL90]